MSAGGTANGGPPRPEVSDALSRAELDVERARERVASSMLALREEVARQVDWRRYVRQQPVLFLGGAVALGFLLGFRR